MRASGKLAAQVLEFAGTLVRPGITTDEIDKAVSQSSPPPNHYHGSVFETIAHSSQDSKLTRTINSNVCVFLSPWPEKVHKMILDNKAYPSPLNYGGFPKSVCTSVNECVCHGIPDDRPLEDGDIVNVDVTVYLNGYHGDTSKMFHVGGWGRWVGYIPYKVVGGDKENDRPR